MKNHWRQLGKLLPSSLERKMYESYFQKEHETWEAQGLGFPPSHLAKQKVLRHFANQYHIHTLIETGTYLGDMVYAMQPFFKEIYSIELSEFYHNKAKQRFSNSKNVHLVLGDSAEKLNELVLQLKEPALFWLDGHYSGGKTALGSKECPVYEELDAIFQSPIPHVIIIDDARLFIGENDYPTIEALSHYVKQHWPDALINVENDSIRITKTN